MEDFAVSLKDLKQHDLWFPLSKIGRRTKACVFATGGLRKGFFSFNDWVALCFMRHQPRYLQSKYNEYLNQEIQNTLRKSISNDGAISLFGKNFYATERGGADNLYELAYFVEQVVVSDQYEIKKILKPDAVVIDAGANVGTFSVFAAHVATQGKVYSFEPTPATFATLKKNTSEYKNIECYRMGLGEKEEDKEFFVYSDGSGGNSYTDSGLALDKEMGGAETAHITTIDHIAALFPKVDFIKIDAEGYEANILNGAKETIKKHKPIIAMSAYHKPNDGEELPSIVRSFDPDYRCRLVKNFDEDLLICEIK